MSPRERNGVEAKRRAVREAQDETRGERPHLRVVQPTEGDQTIAPKDDIPMQFGTMTRDLEPQVEREAEPQPERKSGETRLEAMSRVFESPGEAERKREARLRALKEKAEREKQARLEEAERKRKAELRDAYHKENPRTRLEALGELGEIFMSREKRRALREERQNRKLIKTVPHDKAKEELTKPVPVKWFRRLFIALGAMLTVGTAMQTPEVRSVVGAPGVREQAKRELLLRREVADAEAAAQEAEQELQDYKVHIENVLDTLEARHEALKSLADYPDIQAAIARYLDPANTDEERKRYERALQSTLSEHKVELVPLPTGEYGVRPVAVVEPEETGTAAAAEPRS